MVDNTGLSLDGQWDLFVDESSGDLAVSEAVAEVEKDLSVLVARGIDSEGFVGEPLDDGLEADIRLYLRQLIESDPRVVSVTNVDVSSNGRTETLSVSLDATLGEFSRDIATDVDGDGELETVTVTVAFEDGQLVQVSETG